MFHRFLFALLLGVVGCFAQATNPPTAPSGTATPTPTVTSPVVWAGFAEVGAQSGQSLTGGLGIAATVAANTQVFGELTETTGVGTSQATGVIFGVKTDLPTIKSVTPFTIVGYGGSISSIAKITSVPSGVSGVNASSVTALGTAVGFAQEYAGGFQYRMSNGYDLGIGVKVEKNPSDAWKGYPFLYVGKVF
jgi:hypothetical protein